jgi:hypothetical protein
MDMNVRYLDMNAINFINSFEGKEDPSEKAVAERQLRLEQMISDKMTQVLLDELDELEATRNVNNNNDDDNFLAEVDECVEEAKVERASVGVIEVMVNKYEAKDKEDAVNHMGLIVNRAKGYETEVKELSLDELEATINRGCSIYCSILNLKKGASVKDEQFKEQQVFGIDIDHTDLGLDELLERLPYEPTMIYNTFSHKEEEGIYKYRVLYVADKIIRNASRAKQIRQHLIDTANEVIPSNKEGEAAVDTKCINASRIFFAGRVCYKNEYAIFSTSNIVLNEIKVEVDEDKANVPEGEVESAREAIRANLRSNMIQDLYGNRIVNTEAEIDDIIYRMPLHYLLGLDVKVGEKFNCILEGHKDNNASANIKITLTKRYYFYKCFGCGNTLYITDFIDKEELLETLNIRTLWYENNIQAINYNRDILSNADQLMTSHKKVFKKITTYQNLLSTMLDLAEKQLKGLGRTFAIDKLDHVIISEKYSVLGRMIGRDPKTVQTQLDYLMFMKFIVKLTDEELKEMNPTMLIRNKKQAKGSISNTRGADVKGFNTQYGFIIPKWDMITINDAETILEICKELGATNRGASQRQSQSIGEDTRSKNNKRANKDTADKLHAFYEQSIEEKGYVLKDELLKFAEDSRIGLRTVSSYIATLNREFGLVAKIVNKSFIKHYDGLVAGDSKKRIFVPTSDLALIA